MSFNHQMNIESVALESNVLTMKDEAMMKVSSSNNKEDNEEEASTLETEDMSYSSGGTLSSDKAVIEFKLHGELKSELTQAQVNRISFYNIILEINKGISLMSREGNASSLSSSLSSSSSSSSPLAAIDEEEWVLAAIRHGPVLKSSGGDDGVPSEINKKTVSTSTAQESEESTVLWKPIGSWWEARSKKNPKIGLKNHNKRWSYLWPLINYHKFLAKCIKKLKKSCDNVNDNDNDNHNGSCITSCSSILLLLQEESHGVSGQLAVASQFTGQQWSQKLAFYRGWFSTGTADEDLLRQTIWDLQFVSIKSSSSYNDQQHQPMMQRDHIDKHVYNVIENFKKEYKFQSIDKDDQNKIQTVKKTKTNDKKKTNEERPKRVKKKKGSSTNHRKSSSSPETGVCVSTEVSVCSTSASSYSPIMGVPLPMISQNHIVSPNVPLVCAYPNVICETRHYYLPSVVHPIAHLSTATTPTPGFIHPDGSVHYPLQLTPTSTLDCDSHHSIKTHTEKTSNIKRYNMNSTNS